MTVSTLKIRWGKILSNSLELEINKLDTICHIEVNWVRSTVYIEFNKNITHNAGHRSFCRNAPLARFSSRMSALGISPVLMLKISVNSMSDCAKRTKVDVKKELFCIGIHASHCRRNKSPVRKSSWQRRECNSYYLLLLICFGILAIIIIL